MGKVAIALTVLIAALLVVRTLVLRPLMFLLGFGIEAQSPVSPLWIWTSLISGVLLLWGLVWVGWHFIHRPS